MNEWWIPYCNSVAYTEIIQVSVPSDGFFLEHLCLHAKQWYHNCSNFVCNCHRAIKGETWYWEHISKLDNFLYHNFPKQRTQRYSPKPDSSKIELERTWLSSMEYQNQFLLSMNSPKFSRIWKFGTPLSVCQISERINGYSKGPFECWICAGTLLWVWAWAQTRVRIAPVLKRCLESSLKLE